MIIGSYTGEGDADKYKKPSSKLMAISIHKMPQRRIIFKHCWPMVFSFWSTTPGCSELVGMRRRSASRLGRSSEEARY